VSKTYDHEDGDAGFSPEEQRALALWRVAEPPADLAERVLARAMTPTAAPARRGLALAALAVVMIGGLYTMRTLWRPSLAPRGEQSRMFQADAGPGPEVRQAFDGTGLEPS
jgi:hypothetical protein